MVDLTPSPRAAEALSALETFVERAVAEGQEPASTELKPGARVRLAGAPFFGQVGEVVALSSSPLRLESGMLAPCAEVRVPGKEGHTLVPLSNLSLIGG